jgi:putative tricarboxylic transport membrane protein
VSEILSHLQLGFGVAFSWSNLLVALVGAFFGTLVGVLPGLGPINGVAMLIPIAFAMNLPPETALILLAAVYVGAEYGGRITAILINVPGEASAIMTTLDGYPLARQGLANVALSLSAWSAFCGAIVSVIGIVILAPLLAKWALAFGPAEYFVLMVFAFCCLTSLLGDKPVKGALSALIGLAIATVGVDSNSGVYRYTFDSVHLFDGIQFVVVVIALFAVAELLEMLEKVVGGQHVEVDSSGRKLFNLKELIFTRGSVARSSLLGFVVGVPRPWPIPTRSASSRTRIPTQSSAGATCAGSQRRKRRPPRRLWVLSCLCSRWACRVRARRP